MSAWAARPALRRSLQPCLPRRRAKRLYNTLFTVSYFCCCVKFCGRPPLTDGGGGIRPERVQGLQAAEGGEADPQHEPVPVRRDPTWAPKHPNKAPQQSRPPARSFATPLPEQTADLPVASCLVTKRGPAAGSQLASRLRSQGPLLPTAEPGARAGRPSGRAASR